MSNQHITVKNVSLVFPDVEVGLHVLFSVELGEARVNFLAHQVSTEEYGLPQDVISEAHT